MEISPSEIQLTKPDDWHCHLRDGEYLRTTVKQAAQAFERVIVMPNLNPPVTTSAQAQAYLARIQAHLPAGASLQPLMTLYLTDQTSPAIIQEALDSKIIFGAKLYPAGVTTHSQHGVQDLAKLTPAFEAMEKLGLPLLIHGEVNDPQVDVFDREKVFIEQYLQKLVAQFPHLKIVLEHITTQEAVDFVLGCPATVAATITPQHLWLNRNDLFKGGIRPHHFCLPILKRDIHQHALQQAATSGNPKFFIGTDSAPHAQHKKESACGCAGVFNHYAALEIYATIFEKLGSLEKLEGFSSHFGADFYGLARNTSQCTLRRIEQTIPAQLSFSQEGLVPFLAGEILPWQRL